MNEQNHKITILEQDIGKTEKILEKMFLFYQSFTSDELPKLGKSASGAIVLADIHGFLHLPGNFVPESLPLF